MEGTNFLLHAGYAKAGSTLIAEWFLKNPVLHFSDFTVGGFDGTSDICGLAKTNTAAMPAYFVVADMRFTIPQIEDSDISAIKEIKKYQKNISILLQHLFPAGKVLIVTRGYESILQANYSQYIKEGGTMKFENIGMFSGLVKDLFDYSYLISLYREAFGKENVIVLPYELMKEDTGIFFQKIEKDLQLPHFDFNARIVNPSWKSAELESQRKINSFFDTLEKYGGTAGTMFKKWHVKKLRNKPIERISRNESEVQVGTKTPLIQISEDILVSLREQSKLLKEYPVFEKYMSVY